MITSKELQYVTNNADNIPMPGEDYSLRVLENVKKCYETFNEIYNNKEFNFIFSNGEEILLKIFNYNLPHMLGIDYNDIKGNSFYEARKNVFNTESIDFKANDLLEMIIDNMEKIAENDNDINQTTKFINYYKTQIKCEIFNKFSNFSKFNFGYVHQNDFQKDDEEGNTKNIKSKVLFIPSNEAVAEYFFMRITPNNADNNNSYCVNSLIAPKQEYIKSYFENQEAAIPTQIIISDINKFEKIQATAEEKIQLLNMYKNIVLKYGIESKMNICGDYESILNDINREKLKSL